MNVSLVLGKRAVVKLDIVAIKEFVANVRGLIGLAGELGVGGDVEASKHNLSTVAVAELAVFDSQSKCGHGEGLCCRDLAVLLVRYAAKMQ